MSEQEKGIKERLESVATGIDALCPNGFSHEDIEAIECGIAYIKRLTEEVDLLKDCLIGWREFDWPEEFDRRTAELMVSNYNNRKKQ